MITQYLFLSGGSPNELTSLVQGKISAGWQPYGDPFAVQVATGHFLYYQVVVNTSEVTASATV